MDASEDRRVNPTEEADFGAIVERRFGRRAVLGGLLSSTALAATGGVAWPASAGGASTLTFAEARRDITPTIQLAPGYRADVLIRWGDPVLPDAPPFDPYRQTAAAQRRQFGYNNDYVAFLPLPPGSARSDRGLLSVNHEYTMAEMMFPAEDLDPASQRAQCEIELAAHGVSIVEVARHGGRWRVVPESRYARRIDALDTPLRVGGPAAGHPRLRTAADPTGAHVNGTLNNCGGGKTPWGTVLIAEENFNYYFGGVLPEAHAERANYRRYGISREPVYAFHKFESRFDLSREPNEPNRFGWIVEIDPFDPESVPVKRTALGRFKHEAANLVVNSDGRVVVYSSDDQAFEYIYRFVSDGRFDPVDREANRDLLDRGTLSVGRFASDGTLAWIPLVHGLGPLTPANGFASQADILIETRRAADLVGATPMDRPEDIEASPVGGAVYVMLTNNRRRRPEQVDGPNPRAPNASGHIVELLPPGGAGTRDHAAASFRWDILLLAGDPARPGEGARYHPGLSPSGWLAAPDNCAFDPKGRLWITTDQGLARARNGIPDGLYGCDTVGAGRALTRFLFACPAGAELCGPEFTPDGRTLFVAVQHPGDGAGASFEAPATRWPDFRDGMPPRPAVLAITREDGGEIGS